jgi:hypothetical protein
MPQHELGQGLTTVLAQLIDGKCDSPMVRCLYQTAMSPLSIFQAGIRDRFNIN